MNTPSDSLLMATTANLMVLSRAYRGAADKALADYGLSQATAWPVILAGRLGDGVRQGALAEALGVEGPSLVRVLDQLVAAGLMERREDPHDRRAKTLHLTEAGWRCAPRSRTCWSRCAGACSTASAKTICKPACACPRRSRPRWAAAPPARRRTIGHEAAGAAQCPRSRVLAQSYAGAMLALYLSYSMGLPRPFWAMTTAYIVSQPWSGAVRSKALYRLVGTFVGSAMTVYMVPRLSNSPVVMTAAMALWVGACLYMSVLDRTPRSYLFMLAGYTAAMIGFPSVSEPTLVFDTALARVEEIALGIVCATLVHSVVLPRGLAPALTLLLDKAVRDARLWMQDILAGGDAGKSDKDRRTLANDITQLRLLSTHVPFDTSNLRWTAGAVRAMQDRVAALTPIVSAVEDRMRALQADGQPLPENVTRLLASISKWIDAGPRATHATALRLRAAAVRLTPAIDSRSSWRDALLASLMTRLRELIDGYDECLTLRREIRAGLNGAARRAPRHLDAQRRPLHRDHGMALLSAAAAGLAIAACCAFWIGTAWSNGATAALMAAIFSCFFASQDNPVPGIMQFLTYTVYSIPLSALYLLGIMPAIHSFEMLALSMLPTAFVIGVFIARPASAGKAMAVLFGFVGTMALHDTNTADLVSFIDTQVAQIMGVGLAAVIAAIFRTVSAD